MPVSETGFSSTGTPASCYSLHGLSGLHYVPFYLQTLHQDRLLRDICTSKSRWTQVIKQLGLRTDSPQCLHKLSNSDSHYSLKVSGRRLQSHGGTVHEKWGGLLQGPMPGWLQTLLAKIDEDFHPFDGAANHVLLNAYEAGQGILVSPNALPDLLCPLIAHKKCMANTDSAAGHVAVMVT